MKRIVVAVAVLGAAQIGILAGFTGSAFAAPPLTGNTNCTTSTGVVRFIPGVTATAANGNEKVQIDGQISCTTSSVTSPTITSLTGVFKGEIKFHKSPGANQARTCAKFEGLAPVDRIVAASKYTVAWRALNGTATVAVAASTVHYTGTYSAVVAGTTMTFEMGNAAGGPATTTVVAGSFAGSTAQLLTASLTVPTGGCPVTGSLGIPPNSETVDF
jgi:hypothetical protein